MVRRRNNQSKNRTASKSVSRRDTKTIQHIPSSTITTIKQTPSENLDDETKLAKRHLTKEMWQLVSIAVKRMADELVSISNNQQAVARTVNQEPQTTVMSNSPSAILAEAINIPLQSSLPSLFQQTMIKGAGDVPFVKEKPVVSNEPIKKCTLPIEMLEPSLYIKKKGISNNSIRHRSNKSKIQKRASKKPGKATPKRLRNNKKLK